MVHHKSKHHSKDMAIREPEAHDDAHHSHHKHKTAIRVHHGVHGDKKHGAKKK